MEGKSRKENTEVIDYSVNRSERTGHCAIY